MAYRALAAAKSFFVSPRFLPSLRLSLNTGSILLADGQTSEQNETDKASPLEKHANGDLIAPTDSEAAVRAEKEAPDCLEELQKQTTEAAKADQDASKEKSSQRE